MHNHSKIKNKVNLSQKIDPRKNAWTRAFLKIIFWYIFLFVLLSWQQKKLLIHPTVVSDNYTNAVLTPLHGYVWKPYDAIVVPASKKPKAIVLFFHGNGGSAIDRIVFAKVLRDKATTTVIAQYPEFNGRPVPFTKENVNRTSIDLANAVLKEWPDLPLYVASESFGTGPAAYVVSNLAKSIKKYVAFVPYNSLLEVAEQKFGMFPVSWTFNYEWNVSELLKGAKVPVHAYVANNDHIVGTGQGLKLIAVLKKEGERAEVTMLPGGHNDWFRQLQLEQPQWPQVFED